MKYDFKLKEKLRSDKAKILFIIIVSVTTSVSLVILTKLWEREEPYIVFLAIIGLSFLWVLSGFGAMFK